MMINKRNTAAGIVVLLTTLLLVAGCSKDKYATKPSLTFKSSSSYDIPNGGLFTMRLEFTDAEGDISSVDSSIVIRKKVARCSEPDLVIANYRLPQLPATKNASGEIVIRFENGTANYADQGYAGLSRSGCANAQRPDTVTFWFKIRDQAGNISDSVSTDRPIIIRP